MAEAFAKQHGLTAQSAGTHPGKQVNPIVVNLMRERGIELSSNSPKILTPKMIDEAGLVVTMGCSVDELCPRPMLAQMQKKLVDWHLDDPKGKSTEEVRKIRDEIERLVVQLVERNQVAE